MQNIIDEGQSTDFWFDNCHSKGPFWLMHYNFTVVYDTALPFQAKEAAVINAAGLVWPPARSSDLVETQCSLCDIFVHKKIL